MTLPSKKVGSSVNKKNSSYMFKTNMMNNSSEDLDADKHKAKETQVSTSMADKTDAKEEKEIPKPDTQSDERQKETDVGSSQEEPNAASCKPNNPDEPETEDTSEGPKSLSHAELKVFFQEALGRIIQADPLLSDLHPQITPEEVSALIELEHGRAMRVYVEREGDGEGGGERAWEVVVPREATVHQLKHNLRHHVGRVLSRRGIKKRISWKYVWKNNWLSFEGERLTDDNAKLLQYGIKNKSSLRFVKRYREKQKVGKQTK